MVQSGGAKCFKFVGNTMNKESNVANIPDADLKKRLIKGFDYPEDKPFYKCMADDSKTWMGWYNGGGRIMVAKWTATQRHAKLPDGSKRVLYKNPKYPGESRIRKMKQGRDGKMKAAYVKPPGGRMMGGS